MGSSSVAGGISWDVRNGVGLLLLVYVFFLPFNTLYPFLNVLFILLLLAAALAVGVGRRWPFSRTPLDVSILAFSAWAGLSLINAVDPVYSLHEWRKLVGTQFLVYYLTSGFLISRPMMRTALLLNLLALTLTCLYGIPEFFLAHGSLLEREVRARALTSDYNWLSTYLVMSLPLAYGTVLLETNRIRRAMGRAVLGAAIFLLFLTYTRAAWLAFFVEVLTVSVLLKRRALAIYALSVAAIMAAVFFTLVSYNQGVPQESRIHAGTTASWNLVGRLDFWRVGIEEIRRRPMLGVGYGKESLERLYGFDSFDERYRLHLHNTFLEMALETGLPGLVFFISMVWILLSRFSRVAHQATDEFVRVFAISLFVMVTGMVTRNLFDHMFVSTLAQFFWCFTALGLSLTRQAAAPLERRTVWQAA